MFVPSVKEMYPVPPLTTVSLSGPIVERFEGTSRPSHFAGVATVVAKLFSLTGPCRAYFGEKDYQQLVAIRRMVLDLSMPVDVIGCPTLRESDGLALSSRNVYLNEEERRAASSLNRTLREAAALIETTPGTTELPPLDADVVRTQMIDSIADEPLVELDYAGVVDPDTMEDAQAIDREVRLMIAARVGKPRLLDNMAAKPK